MTGTFRKLMSIPLVVLACAASSLAAGADVTGTWTMGMQGGDHVVPMALVLKQEGAKITGTISMPTNQHGDRKDIPLAGEAGATGYTFATTEGQPLLNFTATLQDDGSLEGTVTAGERQMTWTAERLKERKKG